jgi:purine-binding chemotaxis protein CheW
MDTAGTLTGFVVDTVAEVIRISSDEVQPPPAILKGSTAQECITGVINRGERLLIVLDLNRLFSEEEKASFGAVI